MERSDAELLAATRRGERAAFGTLVERYQGVVCAVTYSSTGDRALSEDVAQDTFLAAWRQLDQLREVGRLRAWLCGIARNLARKARRKTSREALVEPATEPVSDANPFERVSEHESEALVRSALDRVPESYREVLVLYYREQRSVREVAAALEISEAAALQRLSRGRQYLADGVANLVERSLRSALPRRCLVAGLLAALPPLVSSHADATPTSHGVPMLKIALFAAAVAAAGTTAVVVHSSSESTASPSARTEVASLVAAPKVAAPVVVPSAVISAPSVAANPAPPAQASVPANEALPRLDAATIARTRLHEGPSQGPADAEVTVVVFNDMQCKYCGDALGTLDQLQEEFGDKLRIVVKQMPVHKTAELAAEAALAAADQGKFWELHDRMMTQQDDLSLGALLTMAEQSGLDVPKLRKALEKHTYAADVAADMATARELELNGTPAFVINGQRVVGNQPAEEMRALVAKSLGEVAAEKKAEAAGSGS